MQQIGRNCKKLRYVDLGSCFTTNSSCKLLAQNCPDIEVLLLEKCKFISDPGVKALSALKLLRRLSLLQCQKVSSHSVAMFTPLPDLTEFNVGFCKKINDQAVIAVSKTAPKIRICNLSHGVVTDIGLGILVHSCRNITDLDLAFNCVSADAICEAVEGLRLLRLNLCGIMKPKEHGSESLRDPTIEHVAEHGTQLKMLNLRFQEELTDRACEAIGRHCKELQELAIFGLKRVSTKAVELLVESCPLLEEINVWRTEISQKDMERLMEAFPRTRVFD